MNATETLGQLDKLILEHTKAPVTAKLRNTLLPALEQIEALNAEHSTLKNAHTVLKNIKENEITLLKEENAKLVAENMTLMKAQNEPKAQNFGIDFSALEVKQIETMKD